MKISDAEKLENYLNRWPDGSSLDILEAEFHWTYQQCHQVFFILRNHLQIPLIWYRPFDSWEKWYKIAQTQDELEKFKRKFLGPAATRLRTWNQMETGFINQAEPQIRASMRPGQREKVHLTGHLFDILEETNVSSSE